MVLSDAPPTLLALHVARLGLTSKPWAWLFILSGCSAWSRHALCSTTIEQAQLILLQPGEPEGPGLARKAFTFLTRWVTRSLGREDRLEEEAGANRVGASNSVRNAGSGDEDVALFSTLEFALHRSGEVVITIFLSSRLPGNRGLFL